MSTLRYIILPLLVITLSAATASAAPKQQKGGVPTLNTNAKKKSGTGAAAANAALNRSVSRSAVTTAVPMVQNNNPFRHTATPTPPSSSARYEATGSQSSGSSMPIINPRTTRETKGSGLSGGASAGGLMLSGSQYASTAANGGGSSASSTTPSRPRKERPGSWTDPYLNPLGDMAWPLALLALAFAFGQWIAKKLNRSAN